MSDERRRKAQRDALSGTVEDRARAQRAQERADVPPWRTLIGEWVLLVGVRLHYRGRLVDLRTTASGDFVYCLHPLFEIDTFHNGGDGSYGTPKDGGPRYTTPEQPAVIPAGILDISLQPPEWPRGPSGR